MTALSDREARDLHRKLKWLIFFRALFASVLLGSIIIAILREPADFLSFAAPLLGLIALSALALVLSAVYAILLKRIKALWLLAYIQLIVDVLLISAIVFFTGNFASVFSFLYLIVVIYSTMILSRKGGMLCATLCSICYGVLVDLQYYKIIRPFGFAPDFLETNVSWQYIMYKVVITITGCYVVAILSGFLAEQERRARKELWSLEDQMRRVEKLAAVGEMAANLAHEIKNPLASLSGAIQMLSTAIPYSPSNERLIQIALRETKRLSALVNDFLLFARPRSGKPELIQLCEAVKEVVDLFRQDPRCKKGTIRIETNLEKRMHTNIDPEHFRQILWNILNNAADAVSGKEGIIQIECRRAKKDYAEVIIKDNGAGIPQDVEDKIFDPFFSTKLKGTGLGLTVVQQLLGTYGGLIEIESQPQHGTTVILRFKTEE